MAARVIRESYDGGSIELPDTCPRPCNAPDNLVTLDVTERGAARATLHLTRDETLALALTLLATVDELDSPPTASTQTAHDGPGAAPTRGNEGQVGPSTQDDAGGHTRTEAGHGGPSAAVPGRIETTTECWPGCPTCAARRLKAADRLAIDVAQAEAVAAEVHGTEEPLPVEDPGPDDMTEPDEPVGDLTGGSYYASAVAAAERQLAADGVTYADSVERSRAFAAALDRAKAELLANSTPVGRTNPNTCEHGYRFENALCPIAECGASAHIPAVPE